MTTASVSLYVQCVRDTATVLTVAIKPIAVSVAFIALSCELALLGTWRNGAVMGAFCLATTLLVICHLSRRHIHPEIHNVLCLIVSPITYSG